MGDVSRSGARAALVRPSSAGRLGADDWLPRCRGFSAIACERGCRGLTLAAE